MKARTVVGSIFLALICQISFAQEGQTLDLFLGYSYTRVNPQSSIALSPYPLHGGEASVSIKIYRRFAAVADFGLGTTPSRSSNIVGIPIHGTQTSYLFGPRLTLPHWKRLTPFGQILLGFSQAQSGLYATGNSQKSFAWTAGGGLDFRLNGSVSLRPIQVEYLQTHFSEWTNGSQYQKNVRASVGFVLHF